LVIGATGLLGEPVARRLKKDGYTVRIFVIEQELAMAKNRFGDDFEIVSGDIFDQGSLERALERCFGVHINLSGEIEQIGVENIALAAKKLKLQRITYISGTSVAEENTWTPTIKRKFYAEKAIRESGVPYTIFCPTWFMENLPRYIRGDKAILFGKQPNPYHMIAAEDYVRMVVVSYGLETAANKRFIIHGPNGLLFNDALKRYCDFVRPEVKKVTAMPYGLARIISTITGKKAMRSISDWMAAFEKIGEIGNPSEANKILGAPKISFEEWLLKQKKHA
jgi:uncharacterized protein YbjT (DUF2867 family)